MQRILTSLTALKNELVRQDADRSKGQPRDLVLVMRIDMLNTALAALHHYSAPDEAIREALEL